MNIYKFLTILILSILLVSFINNINPKAVQLKTHRNELLYQMTLKEKIAQMIISSAFGEDYDDNNPELQKKKWLCEELKIGGFIFFKGSALGYARLSNKLQSYSKIPLLMSADFERGTRMRVTDGSLFPNNMALGATNNPQLAYEMGKVIAKECRALGIHQNYAPVCDINNNPNNPIINVRSFGEDPQLVSKMSEMLIKGLQDNHVIATAKHFPGHGDTEIDSHSDLPILNFDMDRLNKVELVPFRNAVKNNVMSVMVAHLSFPYLEPDIHLASSLSNNIVNNLLINDLGFDGLIVTDALNMKGITKYYSTEDIAVLCVKAGIDLILMPEDESKAISAIEKAVLNGDINEERIDRSVDKILNAKKWAGLFENKYTNDIDVYKLINTDETQKIAQQIADESITLVKDEKNLLPVNFRNRKVIIYNIGDVKDNKSTEHLNNIAAKLYPGIETFNISEELNETQLSEYTDKITDKDLIIYAIYAKVKFGTGKISILPSHVKLLEKLHESGKSVITVSFGNPYLLNNFTFVDNYILTYSDSEVSINSFIKAVSGDIKFNGILPITVTENYKYGSGIKK